MENIILQFPAAAATIAAAILACLGLWLLLRRLVTRKTIEDINRRFDGGDSLDYILPAFNTLPLNELWDSERYGKLDIHVSNSITDAISLKNYFRSIRLLVKGSKKQEAVMGLVLGSMKRILTTRDLALIYADCLIRKNPDDFKAEKTLIESIIIEEHLDKDNSERIDRFRNEVLKNITASIANSRDEDARVHLRRLKISFDNSHLPRRLDLDLTKLNF